MWIVSLRSLLRCNVPQGKSILQFPPFYYALQFQLGVPIPTVIGPKVLAQARELCKGEERGAHVLEPGVWVSESVGNQEARFYKIKMTEELAEDGVMIKCKASAGSKFKLVLFDREGKKAFIVLCLFPS